MPLWIKHGRQTMKGSRMIGMYIQLTKTLATALVSTMLAAAGANVQPQDLHRSVQPLAYMGAIRIAAEQNGLDPETATAIAYCESELQQYRPGGEVFRGIPNPDDVGIFQINTYFHLAQANKMGYNLESFQGNLDFAMYLMVGEGTAPWKASKPCWSKAHPSW